MKIRQKGNRNRNALIKHLERQGFNVGIVERTGRFIKNKDLFNLFDLICLSELGNVVLVQVSSNTPHTHKNLDAFKTKYSRLCIRQYVWKDYQKHFDRFDYRGDGTWEKKECYVITAKNTSAQKKST